MGVEQEDQLHQDRRCVGLLGAKVEHRHDVALIVTAHRESDPGGQRALVREDHVTEEERAQHLQSCNPPLWAWKMATTTVGKPSKVVRMLAFMLRFLFNTPFVQYSPYLPKSSWWGCSDASASDDGLAFVGGAPTRWNRTRRRCTGSMSRSMWRSTLGLSRMGIQSGWSIDFASGHAVDAAQGLLDVLQVHRLPFHHDLQNFHNQDMFVGRHENLRDVRVDHEAQPRVNLRQVRLLPAKWGAQCQESGQQCHRHVHCPLALKQPQEVVDEDEVPVHLREKRVEDPEQKGCQASPVGLGTSHAIGAYLVHPPFFPQ